MTEVVAGEGERAEDSTADGDAVDEGPTRKHSSTLGTCGLLLNVARSTDGGPAAVEARDGLTSTMRPSATARMTQRPAHSLTGRQSRAETRSAGTRWRSAQEGREGGLALEEAGDGSHGSVAGTRRAFEACKEEKGTPPPRSLVGARMWRSSFPLASRLSCAFFSRTSACGYGALLTETRWTEECCSARAGLYSSIRRRDASLRVEVVREPLACKRPRESVSGSGGRNKCSRLREA